MNPYLIQIREQYASLEAANKAITDKVAADKRNMTDQERELLTKQIELAKTLKLEIDMLQAAERDSAAIDAQAREIAALIAPATAPGTGQFGQAGTDQTRSANVGGATAVDRDPGHYTATGTGSFFRDLVRARHGDEAAARRLVENGKHVLHQRGMGEAQVRDLTSASAGTGVIPPRWMTELFAARTNMGRPLTRRIRNIPLGDNPAPMTLPKETADAPIGVQAAENTPPVSSPDWDSDTDTVTPITITGKQVVSRQLIDSATPAVDQLIFSSLERKYDNLVERWTVWTIEQANTSLLTASGSVAVTDATHYQRRILDAMTEVFATRHLPPDIIFGSPRRFGKVLGLLDTTGRPLVLPGFNMGPSNSTGVANLGQAFGGSVWHGVELVATPGEYDDGRLYTLGRDDAIHFESDVMRFRYEEKSGPQSIELGLWAYNAWWVMYKPQSVKGVTITGDGESA